MVLLSFADLVKMKGRKKRKGEKKLLLRGSQHLDEGMTVKKGMNLDELFIYWSLKLRGKSNSLLS